MKTAKLTIKSLTMFMGMMALTVFIFSCAKTGSDQNPNNNVYANCASCGAISGGQSFFQSQSQSTIYAMNVNLNFIGNVGYNTQYNSPQTQQYPYNQYNNGSYNPIISYSGAVAAQGQMILNQPIGTQYNQNYNTQYAQQYGSCYLPAGTYTIQTMQTGQWSQAIVRGLVLAATGPVQVVISIPQAQVSAKSQLGATWNEVAPAGRLFGNFVIQSVNGVACNIGTLIQ